MEVIQCDQEENKSKQALEVIGHVVAEFYANTHSIHGRRQFVVLNATIHTYNKSYLSDNGKIYKINKTNILYS
jgi:hypothetical protein